MLYGDFFNTKMANMCNLYHARAPHHIVGLKEMVTMNVSQFS